MAQLFLSFLIASVVGTAFALLLGLIKPVTKKHLSASWHYYIWIGVLIVMMLPVRLNIPQAKPEAVIAQEKPHTEEKAPIKTEPIDTENSAADKTDIQAESVVTNENTNIVTPDTQNTPVENYVPQKAPITATVNETAVTNEIVIKEEIKKNVLNVMSYMWLAGVLLFAMIKLFGYGKFIVKMKKESYKTDSDCTLGYTKRQVEVRRSESLNSPLLFGIFKPSLILPDRELTNEQLRNILSHEMTHLKRGDILYKWFVEIVKCVHWFNPCIYWVSKRINEECEISCDLKATQNMDKIAQNSYMDTILSLLTDNSQKTVLLTTSMTGGKEALKKRFDEIVNRKRTGKIACVISPLLAVGVLLPSLLLSGVSIDKMYDNTDYLLEKDTETETENKTHTRQEIESNLELSEENERVYGEIIEKYNTAIKEQWNEKLIQENLNEMIHYYYGDAREEYLFFDMRKSWDLGYCLIDLDGDESDELIIGGFSYEDNSVEIYDLYTSIDQTPVRVLECWESEFYHLCKEAEDYKILNTTYDLGYISWDYCSFENGELKSEKKVYLDELLYDEDRWFMTTDTDNDESNDTPIDEETAQGIIASCEEKYVLPRYYVFEAWKIERVAVGEYTEQEKEIIEAFYEANDFWGMWVYGQHYVTDRESHSQNMYYGAVDSDSPIQTKEELKAAFETYFTKDLTEEFMSFLNPEDIDGKLYIAYGDVGDNGESVEGVSVSKISDEKYFLTLDMYSYFEETSFTRYVYYIYEDGKWVFENDDMDNYFFHWQKHENIEYLPVMKKYYLAMLEEWEWEKIEEYGLVDIMLGFEEPLKSIGYCLMDVNGDGVNELLIGKLNAGDKIVRDMYSVKNGQAYRVLVSGDRNRHYICESDEGYIIANEIHANAMNYSYSYYADLDENVLKERLWFDWTEGEWYHSADYLNGASQVVDEEQVNEIAENYRAKYITPQFISFETLG